MSTAVLVRFRLGDIHPTKMSVNFLGWSFQDLVFEIPRKTPENEILWDVCLLKTHCACVRALLERATDDKVISSYSLLPFAAIHIRNECVSRWPAVMCVRSIIGNDKLRPETWESGSVHSLVDQSTTNNPAMGLPYPEARQLISCNSFWLLIYVRL